MRRKRFIDILNWDTLVAPGVLLCKDGKCIAGWGVRGFDTESMDLEDYDARLRQLTQGLRVFGDTQSFTFVYQREPWATSRQGPDPAVSPQDTASAADPFRVRAAPPEALEVLEHEAAALLAAPGVLWENTLTLYLTSDLRSSHGDQSLEAQLEAFEAQCRSVENRLGGQLEMNRLGPVYFDDPNGSLAHHTPQRLVSCALCERLSRLLSLRDRRVLIGTDQKPVHWPLAVDRLLGATLHREERLGRVQVNDAPLAIYALEGFGQSIPLGVPIRLQSMDLPFVWVTQFNCQSARETQRRAMGIQRQWRQSASNLTSALTTDPAEAPQKRSRYEDAMADQVEDTLDAVKSGEVGFGQYATVMMLRASPSSPRDTLRADTETLEKTVLGTGLELREEVENATSAFLGALPGHPNANPRKVMIPTQAFVDLLPLRSIWQGSPDCPSPMIEGPALMSARAGSSEHFNVNLHVGDLGHSLVFGPTGAGKSVLLGMLIAHWLKYDAAQVVYFDKQRSSRHICNALGGMFIEPGTGGEHGVAPLAHLKTLGTPWAARWLERLILDGAQRFSRNEQNQINAALDMLAAQGATPTLQQVFEFVQSDTLRAGLEPWLKGPFKDMFNADHLNVQDALTKSALTVFECHELLDAGGTASVLAIDYIFEEVGKRLTGERPTLIVFDEAWAFFRDEMFVNRIRSWLKEARKLNCAIVMATQSIGDAIKAEITEELLESCPTKIFLPNTQATTEYVYEQYRALGLSRTQIDLVATARPKQDYYLVQPENTRVFNVPIGPCGLSLLGRTSMEESARAARQYTTNPDYWKEELLNG